MSFDTLDTIYESIQEDLVQVENSLKSVGDVEPSWLAKMLNHTLKGSGKRIRPALTLLAGKFYRYNLTNLLPMATAIELMHTATLVHDDAIDNSFVRRNRPTVNKLWGKDKAVLLGDYLFGKAGEVVTNTQSLKVVKLFSQTIMIIAGGELNQALSAFNLQQKFEHYIHRISSKTASLFSLATESGAILSQAPESSTKALREYGYNLGVGFQIVDDILDFTSTEQELGKPIGSDLAQGTFTLPAMLLMARNPEDNPVKRIFEHENTEENIQLAIELVRTSSIVEECYKVASDYCSRASDNLKLLPDNITRQALSDLTNYVLSRRR